MVVAIALALAAVAFVLLHRHQLEASLRTIAEQRAADVSTQVAIEGATVDLSGGGDQTLLQVVASDGTVLASSASVAGEPPVVDSVPRPGQIMVIDVDRLPIGEEEAFAVVARGARSPDGEVVVIAAQSLESVQRSTAVIVGLLAAGYPLVLVIVAGACYWVTGRSVAPVEAMRRRVAAITATDLSARVPVPGGGDEISHLATTMNNMIERLEAASAAQRRFVADASHELRSPLSTIRATHEIAAAHPDSMQWSVAGRDVLAELDRVDRLVGDLLLLARADERGLVLQTRDVDLDDLVLTEVARLRRVGAVDVSVHAPPVRVVGDPHHLARALRNLTDNAARHAAGRIELQLSQQPRAATIEVVDDGPGIDPADRERVFERFARLDQSRTRDSGGTGLGLAISREIARAHRGDVLVADSSSGARLVLTLPRGGVPPDDSS
ncbi:MAG: ATP-binding protein [Nocardioidaceae bacterium]